MYSRDTDRGNSRGGGCTPRRSEAGAPIQKQVGEATRSKLVALGNENGSKGGAEDRSVAGALAALKASPAALKAAPAATNASPFSPFSPAAGAAGRKRKAGATPGDTPGNSSKGHAAAVE